MDNHPAQPFPCVPGQAEWHGNVYHATCLPAGLCPAPPAHGSTTDSDLGRECHQNNFTQGTIFLKTSFGKIPCGGNLREF